mmetsp:Transcript_114861/g.325337  ORF Transcript_114861/g.325337 Transcript_114861/m.325337 type:complete len:221 (+) Transcript_114861:412-1074(+)
MEGGERSLHAGEEREELVIERPGVAQVWHDCRGLPGGELARLGLRAWLHAPFQGRQAARGEAEGQAPREGRRQRRGRAHVARARQQRGVGGGAQRLRPGHSRERLQFRGARLQAEALGRLRPRGGRLARPRARAWIHENQARRRDLLEAKCCYIHTHHEGLVRGHRQVSDPGRTGLRRRRRRDGGRARARPRVRGRRAETCGLLRGRWGAVVVSDGNRIS